MDPSASSAAAGSSSGMKRRGCPPGSSNKVKVPAWWMPGAEGPLRIGAPMQGEANRAAPGTSSALTLRGLAPGGALNAPSPVAVVPAPRALGSIDRVLREVEAILGPLPPAADGPGPQEAAPPGTGVVATPHRLAAEMLGPLVAPGCHFLELLVVVDAWSFFSLWLPDAVQRVIYAPRRFLRRGRAGGAKQARAPLAC
jgi:hypothetical protein